MVAHEMCMPAEIGNASHGNCINISTHGACLQILELVDEDTLAAARDYLEKNYGVSG